MNAGDRGGGDGHGMGVPLHPQMAPAQAVDEKMQARVDELERQLAETQAMLYAQAGAMIGGAGGIGVRAGVGVTTEGPFGTNFSAPTAMMAAQAYGGPRLDATGPLALPGAGDPNSYQQSMLSPRPPPRKRGGGAGIYGTTSSFAAGKSGAGHVVVASGEELMGPPFRSQADRRQWLLQEKRRWLVEMRLSGSADAETRLPPIPPGQQLSNGMDVNAIVSPR